MCSQPECSECSMICGASGWSCCDISSGPTPHMNSNSRIRQYMYKFRQSSSCGDLCIYIYFCGKREIAELVSSIFIYRSSYFKQVMSADLDTQDLTAFTMLYPSSIFNFALFLSFSFTIYIENSAKGWNICWSALVFEGNGTSRWWFLLSHG